MNTTLYVVLAVCWQGVAATPHTVKILNAYIEISTKLQKSYIIYDKLNEETSIPMSLDLAKVREKIFPAKKRQLLQK
jgi:hypothetical protein